MPEFKPSNLSPQTLAKPSFHRYYRASLRGSSQGIVIGPWFLSSGDNKEIERLNRHRQ